MSTPKLALVEANLQGETLTRITVTKFQTRDRPDNDDLYPLKIPLTGIKYSYWKSLCLKVITAPDSYIDNIKVYSDGSNTLGTGVALKLGSETPTKYQPATGINGESGNEAVENHDGISTAYDFFEYNSTNKKSVSISESGNQLNAVDEKSDYFIMQIGVEDTASAGTTGLETIFFQYDE